MLRIQLASRNLTLLQAQATQMKSLGWKTYSNIEILFLNDNHKLYIQKLFTHTPTHTPDNIRKLSINTQ